MKNPLHKSAELKQKPPGIIGHIAAWAIFLLFDGNKVYFGGQWLVLEYYIAFILFDISYFYFTAYLLFPAIFRLYQDTFRRLLLVFTTVATYALLLTLINTLLKSLAGGRFIFLITLDDYMVAVTRSMFIASPAFALIYFKQSILKERELANERIGRAIAEKRTVELENALLQSQLNPHLLNNALNIFYIRTRRLDAVTSDYMLLLADLAGYSLEASRESIFIDTDRELEILGKFIKLHRWLAADSVIFFDYELLKSRAVNSLIRPSLMTDLVVNIFKYGDLSNPGQPGKISIRVEEGELRFYSWNLVYQQVSYVSHKSGLESIRKRLEIYYPGRHEFHINKTESTFEVSLKIIL